MTSYGTSLVFGVHEPRELVGFPKGRTRIRQRPDAPVYVYVRPPSGGCLQFVVAPGDVWRPAFLVSRND